VYGITKILMPTQRFIVMINKSRLNKIFKKKFEGDRFIIHINILYTYKCNVHDLIKHNNSLPRKMIDNCIVNDTYFDYHS